MSDLGLIVFGGAAVAALALLAIGFARETRRRRMDRHTMKMMDGRCVRG